MVATRAVTRGPMEWGWDRPRVVASYRDVLVAFDTLLNQAAARAMTMGSVEQGWDRPETIVCNCLSVLRAKVI